MKGMRWPVKLQADDRDEWERRCSTNGHQPDFICIGAQKSGTSWLYHQLTCHADFWMPPVKELHYFDLLSKFKRKKPPRCQDERDRWFMEKLLELTQRPYLDLERYSGLFQCKGTLLCGDITPGYSILSEEIIEQVMDFFPDLKVIFLARDPVERAWSQLSMDVRLGGVRLSDPADGDEVIRNLRNPAVLLRSFPSKIIARWRRYVRPELLRIYFFDDLERQPGKVRDEIISFLGGDPEKPSGRIAPDYNTNRGSEKSRFTDRVRSRLADFFQEELRTCASELGGPAKNWPARYGFSLLWFLLDLANDLDLFGWCDSFT